MRSINLLDKKHYNHLTEEQIMASKASGSLKAKERFVVVRKVAPQIQPTIPYTFEFEQTTTIPSRPRSAITTERVHYEELNVSDDEYANENADIAEEDRTAKYKK